MSSLTDSARMIYGRITYTKRVLMVGLISGIAVSFVVNIFVGSAGLTFMNTVATIFGNAPDNVTQVIIWEFRMPVALAALLIGAGLGMGGCEMQTVLKNPMASPYTLGISAAASFGAAVAIILKLSLVPGMGNLIVSTNAFLFTMIASGIIFIFTENSSADKSIIILFGIALNFLFHSLTAFLQYISDENDLQSLLFWSFGSLMKISWGKLGIIAVVTGLCFILFTRKVWALTAMSLNDVSASSLGVDVTRLRKNTIFLVALLSATIVSFSGTIGFIGLVAPHIARLLSGEDQRYFLPISALIGALTLSVSSILSKSLVPGTILPIGLITSFIGIPFFIWLIIQRRRGSYM